MNRESHGIGIPWLVVAEHSVAFTDVAHVLPMYTACAAAVFSGPDTDIGFVVFSCGALIGYIGTVISFDIGEPSCNYRCENTSNDRGLFY